MQTSLALPVAVGTTATITRFKRSYKVLYARNNELSDTFKQLENRTFDKTGENWGWVVNKESLYDVMMSWKGRPGVNWAFESAALMEEFRGEALAVRDLRRQQATLHESLASRNLSAEAYKADLLGDREFELSVFGSVTRTDTAIKFYYHQHITAAWLIHRGGGILAAEMGLGKTFVFCLAAAVLARPDQKFLIVAPKSLVLGIRDDLVKLLPDVWYFLGYGRKQPNTAEQARVVLTSYSYFARSGFSVEKHLTPFGVDQPGVVVLDESHMVKNPGSLTFKNINASFGGGRCKFICSTGTPIKSWGREIWTQLHLLDPVSFASRTAFEKEYCGSYMHPYFKRIDYDPMLERRSELNALLQPYMFRVRKEDVLNLPPKIYRKLVIPLSAAERKEYEQYRDEIKAQLELDASGAQAMVLLGKMRQYCAQKKVGNVKELVDRHNQEGEKVVIIDQFKDTVYQMAEHYGQRAVVHTGDQSIDERAAAVKHFQRDLHAGAPDGVDAFLGTVDTCKYGLTLTAANIMYLISLPWTPAECDQVFDRCHRISQTRTVLIFIPVLEDTVDEYVYDAVENKRNAVLQIVDNKSFAADMKTSAFADVLKYLLKKTAE